MQIIEKFILFIALFFSTGALYGQTVELRGRVTDSQTGEPLPGASVVVAGTTRGTATDTQGYYTLHIDRGRQTLRVTSIGYLTGETIVEPGTRVLDVKLDPESQQIQAVTVSSRARDGNVKDVAMGVEHLDISTIRQIPPLMGEVDVLKAVQLLPGVQSTSEGGSGFSVRGGSPDQNLVLLDNATVYNASHLMGFFSVFNNDVVGGVEMYKGDMPIRYGGRLSSLLKVDTKTNVPQRFSGTGGLGLISARLMMEGPIGERTSWTVGARRSYADVFLKFSNDEAQRNSTLYFYDLNAKLTHRFSERDRLELNGYYGNDVFDADKMARMHYGNGAASLNWSHLFSSRFSSRVSASWSDYGYGMGMDADGMNVDWKAGISDVALRADFSYRVGRWLDAEWGASAILHRFRPANVSQTGYDNYDIEGGRALENGVWLGNTQELASWLTVRYGVRLAAFQNMGPIETYTYDADHEPLDTLQYGSGKIYHTYVRAEPRAGAVVKLSANSSVKASYARNVQFIQLAENSSAGSPVNVWFPASGNILPQTADIFSVGYFRNFRDNDFETSVEVYYKSLQNVIDFADHADLLLNRQLEGQVRTGSGRAYGAEFSVRKNSGRLTGFVNYTLSRTERTIPEINDGVTYLAPYDKTHAVNVLVNYEFSRRWNASALWVYATGMPTTYPTGRFEVNGEYFPIYSGRNEYRKPAYHRLDLSVNYIPRHDPAKRWQGEWNFSLYNAYGRKNPWLITYNQSDSPTPQAEMIYLFSFVPSITYNFKF